MNGRGVDADNSSERVAWMSVREAAGVLAIPELTLRRALERNAKRAPTGTVVAAVDGVLGRKFGRKWRVRLDSLWLSCPGGG